MDDDYYTFMIYAHGFNGDSSFCEPWDFAPTLEGARQIATRVMKKDRLDNLLPDGTPTIQWMEVFGPGIEESLGLEEKDGELIWT